MKQATPCLDFFPLEAVCLHDVAGFEFLEAFEPNATLLARGHLPHVLLEVLQRADPALEDLLLAPQQLGPTATGYLALDDTAAGDHALARDLDRDHDLDLALTNLTISRLTQTFGCTLDVFGELVDDVVVADLDLCSFRGRDG